MKRTQLRGGLLTLGLLATLLLTYFAPSPHDEVVAPAAAPNGTTLATSSARGSDASPRTVEVLSLRSRNVEDELGSGAPGVFKSAQWEPQAAAPTPVELPAAAQEAPAPQAPPLPFKVLGQYSQGGQAGVFLQYNDQNLVVHVGDTIAQQYKVESLSGTSLTLRYLPLDLQQTLDMSSTN